MTVRAEFLNPTDAERVHALAEAALAGRWPDHRGEVSATLTADGGTAVRFRAEPTYGGTVLEFDAGGPMMARAHIAGWHPGDGPVLPEGIAAVVVPGEVSEPYMAPTLEAVLDAGWFSVDRIAADLLPTVCEMVNRFAEVDPERRGDVLVYRGPRECALEIHPRPDEPTGSHVLLQAGPVAFLLVAPFWHRFDPKGRQIHGGVVKLHHERVEGASWWVHPGRWAAEQAEGAQG